MSEAKPRSPKVRAKTPVVRRAPAKTVPRHMGTDIEAFYAAQKEAAADSRAYAERRRQR